MNLHYSDIYRLIIISLTFFMALPCFSEEPPVVTAVPQSIQELKLSYAPVVKKVAPAVVNIYAARVVQASESPFMMDPFFQQFFGGAFPMGRSVPHIQRSLGSGVIVRPDGIVITNYHVIANAEEIKVVLFDGRELAAEIVVKDKRTDLAALKLKTKDKDLPFLLLGDVDELEVGDIVLAVGNPFGLGNTVTSGIVSALARSQIGISDVNSLIQTDAAVNPGNSGGPLVTLDGKIVGINTAIFSRSGGSIGIGFAIPSNLVAPVIAAVEQGGVVKRAWLGVSMQDIQKDRLEGLGLEKAHGVLITKVFKNSPAERAGLKEGDVILKINGHPTLDEAAFRFRLATLKIGTIATLSFWREKHDLEVSITLETPPDLPGNQIITLEEWRRHPLAGADVTGFSPAVASTLGLGFEEEGVIIVQVRPNSRASFAGFRPGDVILEINDTRVKTIEDLQRNLGRKQSGWKILFDREGVRQSIVVRHW